MNYYIGLVIKELTCFDSSFGYAVFRKVSVQPIFFSFVKRIHLLQGIFHNSNKLRVRIISYHVFKIGRGERFNAILQDGDAFFFLFIGCGGIFTSG